MSRAQCLVCRGNQLLMVLHRREGEEWWCLPGGEIKPGESPEAAALRELKEECRVDGRVLKLAAMVEYGECDHHHTYQVDIGEQTPSLGDAPDKPEEAKVLVGVAWLSLADMVERDRVYLWTAGLLTVKQFASEVETWNRRRSAPAAGSKVLLQSTRPRGMADHDPTTAEAASYIILNYSIEDALAFAAYQGEARDYVLSGILDFLVYEPRTEILEGEFVGHQTVIFRFRSAEAARSFYYSKEYQKVLPMRLRSTARHFAILVSDRVPSASRKAELA